MQKRILYVMTAVLLAVVVTLCAVSLQQTQSDLMSFRIPSVEGERSISLWEKEDGRFYVFLPSYADLNQMEIDLHTESPVQIGGILLEEGMRCSSFALDTPYAISWRAWGKTHQREITFVQSAHIPAMYIDTQSGSMDYIHQKKGNKETGWMTVYRADGTLDYSGQMESIQGRGNFTWLSYDKKAYSVKLSESTNLLGLGEAQKWVLLANAGDPTNLRNKIVYEFADAVGLSYSPDSTWADVYLNGEYAGVYLLSERNEVHRERVDIEGGGFLISLEVLSKLKAQNIPAVTTDALQTFRVHYPQKPDTVTMDSVQSVMQSVENAILSENGIDYLTGRHWTELIDMESWVKKYLIEEIFGNGDAGSISQFFYMDDNDSEGKVYAGPVWDYDRTMGNPVAWHLISPKTFYANRTHANPDHSTPWFHALYQKPVFYQNVRNFYQQDFRPKLEMLLEHEIYEYAEQLQHASAMNDIRWFTKDDNSIIHLHSIVEYMNTRQSVLDALWVEERPYYRVRADQSLGANYTNYIVFQGEALEMLPVFEDSENLYFDGWYYKGTDEPFDPERPITEDIEIYAKWQDKPARLLGRVEKLLPLGVFVLCLGLVFLAELRRWNWHSFRKR